MTAWSPQVRKGSAPLYDRIADAIERDIRDGTLPSGARLPAHRDLAYGLSVSIGTITKAYGEAERRGLITGHVGRGSFVAEPGAPASATSPGGLVDLARAIPAPGPDARDLADAFAGLRRRADLMHATEYTIPEGIESVRRAGADWIRRRHGLERVRAEDLIQTNGGQNALALVLSALCRPGDVILCEAATYHGVKTLAEVGCYRLHGVALDVDGLNPDALEEAIVETGARVLYTMPTLQNPTTITMSVARRNQIVAVARKHGVTIVEDDAYRATASPEDQPPTLAEIAPEQTVYVATISKSLSPGLRVGFVRPPNASVRDRILRAVRGTGYAPPALGALVFSQWVDSGMADQLADRIVEEARRRTELARRIFGNALARPGSRQVLHVWLPLPSLEAERAAGRALRAGVEVTPPDAPIVASDKISGLRVCLGATDIATLESALDIVAKALRAEVSDQARAVV